MKLIRNYLILMCLAVFVFTACKFLDSVNPKTCPPDHPYCMCRDEVRQLDCSYSPVNPIPIFGPGSARDGGTDTGDATSDVKGE